MHIQQGSGVLRSLVEEIADGKRLGVIKESLLVVNCKNAPPIRMHFVNISMEGRP